MIKVDNRMARKSLPLPIKKSIPHISGPTIYYGCGVDTFTPAAVKKIKCCYDPFVIGKNSIKPIKYETALSVYVLNVLPPENRAEYLSMLSIVADKAIITVRADKVTGEKYKDGVVLPGNRFQKIYTENSLIKDISTFFKNIELIEKTGGYITMKAESKKIKLPSRPKKYGVGKMMGYRVYIHVDYAKDLPGFDVAIKKMPTGFKPCIVRYDEKDESIAMIECHDFDTAHEPTVGRSFMVRKDGSTKLTLPPPVDPWIYHHKWLMVSDDYSGFNVEKEKARSRAWMSLHGIDYHRIGKRSFWQANVIPRLI
jgi:hypothetical protein